MFTDTVDNLTQGEKIALKELKTAQDIVIKKADKGNILVVMDTEFYRDKLVMKDHLSTDTYQKVEPYADKSVMKDLQNLLDKHKNNLTDHEFKYVLNPNWKSSNFYTLPKVHKSKTSSKEQ